MEPIDILHIILATVFILVIIVGIVIGIYVISLLVMAKKILRRIDTISFNIAHIKSFAKIGTLGMLSKIVQAIKRGGVNE